MELLKEINGTKTNGIGIIHINGHTNGTAAKSARIDHRVNGQPIPDHAKLSDKQTIETAVRMILTGVGENPDRDGLIGTPNRISRMYDELLGGYRVDPIKMVNGALFDVEYSEPVIVRDIEYFSMCEHHMLPFNGRAHVAYIPSGKVIGLSKIPRLVDMFARRLQVQERMTHQIAEMLDEILSPQGVAVAVEGQHMCSTMRGVKKEHPVMFTTSFTGLYRDDRESRKEFLSLIQNSQQQVW
ncbi:MAG: GTP cyclohydrolase I FolE [Candidatus Promineifilaceae bacterium]|jgi:GTP cyclohydrolase I